MKNLPVDLTMVDRSKPVKESAKASTFDKELGELFENSKEYDRGTSASGDPEGDGKGGEV